MRRFLLVEDDEQLAEVLIDACHDLCDATVLVSSGDTAEAMLQDRPDLAIIDLVLPEKLGFGVAFYAAHNNVPALLISGHEYADMLCELLGVACLIKPFGLQELVAKTEAILADPAANIARLRRACTLLQEETRKNHPIMRSALARNHRRFKVG
jgi:DNA-binding response OmpR family regulator